MIHVHQTVQETGTSWY